MSEKQTAREVLDGIKAQLAAATQGRWFWAGNTDTNTLRLAAWEKGIGQVTVMDFERWGMQSAAPRFREKDTWMMLKGKDLVQYEVARNQGLPADTPRSHPKVYRADVVGINHPDATFIASAPSTVARLTAAIEAALSRADRWESIANARDQDNLIETDPELWAENRTRAIALRSNANNLRTAIENALKESQ